MAEEQNLEEVKSPCNELCLMDEETGLCIGCLRTSDEIAQWSSYSNEEKQGVLEEIKTRKI